MATGAVTGAIVVAVVAIGGGRGGEGGNAVAGEKEKERNAMPSVQTYINKDAKEDKTSALKQIET